MRQLFTFIQADFSKYDQRLQPSGASDASQPEYPKSLFLIRPLHLREFNAVAGNAQASVEIPTGLDLNAWIVPPSRLKELTNEPIASGSEGEAQEPVAKIRKKGKGKADGPKSKGSKRKEHRVKEETDPVDSTEEWTARERVRFTSGS